jgi:hypothetical protein
VTRRWFAVVCVGWLLALCGYAVTLTPQQEILLLGGRAPYWVLRANGVLPKVDCLLTANQCWVQGQGTLAASSQMAISRASQETTTDCNGNLAYAVSNVLAITCAGLQVWEGRINVALYSNDLTQSADWTTSNVTAAKNLTGPDGVANSASTITAGANNGTILQSITLGSSARFQSAYVIRIAGSGVVRRLLR